MMKLVDDFFFFGSLLVRKNLYGLLDLSIVISPLFANRLSSSLTKFCGSLTS